MNHIKPETWPYVVAYGQKGYYLFDASNGKDCKHIGVWKTPKGAFNKARKLTSIKK